MTLAGIKLKGKTLCSVGSPRPNIMVEAASPFGWERYLGSEGISLTMKGFGASGPAGVLAKHFGFTVEHLTELVNNYLA